MPHHDINKVGKFRFDKTSYLDGFPLVCGGALEEAAVGCRTFYPGKRPAPSSSSLPGVWTARGGYNSTFLP